MIYFLQHPRGAVCFYAEINGLLMKIDFRGFFLKMLAFFDNKWYNNIIA